MHQKLAFILNKHFDHLHQVVPFDEKKDKLVKIDLSVANAALNEEVYKDTDGFSAYIDNRLATSDARYAIGGYLEKRNLYKRSALFETLKASKKTFDRIYVSATTSETTITDEVSQRSIHLGTDIWGKVGTPVFAALGGTVHSFAFNNQFGDYGATIILQHQLDGLVFHTLYGHLSKADLAINVNQYIAVGETIGHFGPAEENGYWPPHLHFQIIIDMELKIGDYPGVCHVDDMPYYKMNCPDPDLLLQMNKWIN